MELGQMFSAELWMVDPELASWLTVEWVFRGLVLSAIILMFVRLMRR